MGKSDPVRRVPMDVAVALALLTRLPLPSLPQSAFASQARAVWAFPVVGAVTGVLAASVGLGTLSLGLPATVAAGLCLAVQILLTGAMHEDGLADTADGLWGGWSRERRLEIMKDSAIGTYGVLALILSLGLRWSALTLLLPLGAAPVIAAAMLSRAAMPVIMAALPHARADGLSRSVGAPPRPAVLAGLVLALGSAALLLGMAIIAPVLSAAALVAGLALLARARIGGQTGDILGASQQLAEIAVLLGLLAALPE